MNYGWTDIRKDNSDVINVADPPERKCSPNLRKSNNPIKPPLASIPNTSTNTIDKGEAVIIDLVSDSDENNVPSVKSVRKTNVFSVETEPITSTSKAKTSSPKTAINTKPEELHKSVTDRARSTAYPIITPSQDADVTKQPETIRTPSAVGKLYTIDVDNISKPDDQEVVDQVMPTISIHHPN